MSTSDSTPHTPPDKPQKPNKPYPEWPLFAHAAGVWAKKVRGKLHHFGLRPAHPGAPGLRRRCALWPETAAALRTALDARPAPKDPADAALVFVTGFGQPWANGTADQAPSKAFAKPLRALGLNARGGPGLYTLRHTFRTVASGARDRPAADRNTGHETPHMSSVCHGTISDERLRAVSGHVRRRLFEAKEGQGGAEAAGRFGDATSRRCSGHGAALGGLCGTTRRSRSD